MSPRKRCSDTEVCNNNGPKAYKAFDSRTKNTKKLAGANWVKGSIQEWRINVERIQVS